MKLLTRILGALALLAVAAIGAGAVALSHDSACTPASPLPTGTASMKAIAYRCYGPPEVLALEDIAKPVPAADQVLVKVHAAGTNPLDWHYMRGKPYVMRFQTGIGAPASPQLGVDFAGTVEAVGHDVTRYKPGDEVFGGGHGSFAEYIAVRAHRAIAHKPANISFEQAAAVPIAAVTALQALRDKGQLRPGQKVLINGASGGVGTFAVQIAKSMGGEVTGVCSTRNLELVRSLGADRVIDYTNEDYTTGTTRYDLILDNVGNHTLRENRSVLNPQGIYVMIGGSGGGDLLGPIAGALAAPLLSALGSQQMMFFMAQLNHEDLETLGTLMREGKLTPVIDRRYPMSEAPEAITYLETARARGKVVLGW